MAFKKSSLAISLILLVICLTDAKFLHEQEFVHPECTCPEDHPNWNGELCVKCEPQQFWDEGVKACRECNETWTYDWVAHRCVCPVELPHVQNGRCIACGNM